MSASLLGPLDYMFGEVLRLAVAVVVALGLGVLAVARYRGWTLERAARVWLLMASVATVWVFTQHNPYGGSGRVVDLNPFGDLEIAANTTGRYRDLVVANVLLFVPLGVALAWQGLRFVRTVACAAALSVLCEVVQYATNHGRVAQTGDVLVNVAGAVVGWAVFVALTGGWGPLSPADHPATGPARRRRTPYARTSSGSERVAR